MAGKRFLLVKGSSGLGNRMEVAMAAILYARLSNRELVIDWSDHLYSDGENVFHKLFDCPAHAPSDELPLTDSTYPAIWRDHMSKTVHEMRNQFGYTSDDVRKHLAADISQIDRKEELVVLAGYQLNLDKLRPYFPGRFDEFVGKSEAFVISEMLRRELILRPEISAKVEKFRLEHFAHPTIGIHIRYSDRRSNVLGLIRRLNKVRRAAPQAGIFLATDNILIKERFERNYPTVVSTSHWYPSAGRPIHWTGKNHDKLASAIDGLIDIYLLAGCDYLIFDRSSSFARLAAAMSNSDPRRTFTVSGGYILSTNSSWISLLTGYLHRQYVDLITRLVPLRLI